jgi:hypothetical protein
MGTAEAERPRHEAEQYLLPGLADTRCLALASPTGRRPANEDRPAALRDYHVRCRGDLHRAVQAASRRAGTSAAQLVRCALAMLPEDRLHGLPDPGGPTPRDARRVGRRLETPLLRLRLPVGLTTPMVRRVLGFVADTAAGANAVVPVRTVQSLHRDLEAGTAHRDRLAEALGVLAGEPLEGGVAGRPEALHVMRFPPGAKPTREEVARRFRALAAVLHPDIGLLGHHVFMAQLLDARRLLAMP